jgi:hypothetical protein
VQYTTDSKETWKKKYYNEDAPRFQKGARVYLEIKCSLLELGVGGFRPLEKVISIQFYSIQLKNKLASD